MAMTKLTKKARHELRVLVVNHIQVVPDRTALDKAKEACRAAIFAAIEKQFPAEDMVVLKKYGATAPLYWIPLQIVYDAAQGDVRHDNWELPNQTLEERAALPEMPSSAYNSHGRCVLKLEDAAADTMKVYYAAKSAFNNATAEKQKPFFELIEAARYLEQVEEAWPEASRIRPFLKSALPVVQIAPLQDKVKEVLDAETGE